MAINKFGKGGFDSADSSFQGLGVLASSNSASIFGCTDPTQFNYNAAANVDDQSCIPIIHGCLDPLSPNFNDHDGDGVSNAITQDPFTDVNTDDGSCIYYGCTDNTAYNYDPDANTDTNPTSCIPFVYGCTDSSADLNYFSYTRSGVDYHVNDPANATCLTCQTFNLRLNFDSNANTNQVSLTNAADPCITRVYGCMQLNASNYDPLANTQPQDFCEFIFPGCMDNGIVTSGIIACNYDSNATVDNGSCEYTTCAGCTDSNFPYNYDSSATIDDGSCQNAPPIPVLGCTDPSALNYDSLANTDDNSCVDIVNGCISPSADNYDLLANTDDNSCQFCNALSSITVTNPIGIYNINVTWAQSAPDAAVTNIQLSYRIDGSGNNFTYILLPPSDTDYNISVPFDNTTYEIVVSNICSTTTSSSINTAATTVQAPILIYGCTDTGAFNYDPNLNANTNQVSATDLSDPCIPVSSGCTDDGSDPSFPGRPSGAVTGPANNFNINANTNDGSCAYTIFGCIDPNADNASINSNANTNDGSCTYSGCTDPAASNFSFPNSNVTPNSLAYENGNAVDDGSCTYPVYGCQDATALNYDAAATVDDGSCAYPVAGCTDSFALNYNSAAVVDDGTCVGAGCTNQTADNYDPAAVNDNGGCTFTGCLDPYADNYYFSLIPLPAAAPPNANYYVLPGGPINLNENPNATNSVTNYDPGGDNLTLMSGQQLSLPIGHQARSSSSGNFGIGIIGFTGIRKYKNYPGAPVPNNNSLVPNIFNDQSTCSFPNIDGCTDPAAYNYLTPPIGMDVVDQNNSNCAYLDGTTTSSGVTINTGSFGFFRENGQKVNIGCNDDISDPIFNLTNQNVIHGATNATPNEVPPINATPYSVTTAKRYTTTNKGQFDPLASQNDVGCKRWYTQPTWESKIFPGDQNIATGTFYTGAQQPASYSTNSTTFNNQEYHGAFFELSCANGPSQASFGCPNIGNSVGGNFGKVRLQIDNRNSKRYFEETLVKPGSLGSDPWQSPYIHNMVSNVWELYELVESSARNTTENNARNGIYPPSTGAFTHYVNVTYNTKDKVPFFSANSSSGVQLGSGGVATASGGAAGSVGFAIPVKVGCTDYRAKNYCPTCNADHKITGAQVPNNIMHAGGGATVWVVNNAFAPITLQPLPGSTSIGNEFTYCNYTL